MEAAARAPADVKGRAMRVYAAFIDPALGLFALLLELIANAIGLTQIFLISALFALGTVPVVARLRTRPSALLHVGGSGKKSLEP